MVGRAAEHRRQDMSRESCHFNSDRVVHTTSHEINMTTLRLSHLLFQSSLMNRKQICK
jgi:hypothetical protein